MIPTTLLRDTTDQPHQGVWLSPQHLLQVNCALLQPSIHLQSRSGSRGRGHSGVYTNTDGLKQQYEQKEQEGMEQKLMEKEMMEQELMEQKLMEQELM